MFFLLPYRWAPAALTISTACPQCQPTGHCGLLKWSDVILLVTWRWRPIWKSEDRSWDLFTHTCTRTRPGNSWTFWCGRSRKRFLASLGQQTATDLHSPPHTLIHSDTWSWVTLILQETQTWLCTTSKCHYWTPLKSFVLHSSHLVTTQPHFYCVHFIIQCAFYSFCYLDFSLSVPLFIFRLCYVYHGLCYLYDCFVIHISWVVVGWSTHRFVVYVQWQRAILFHSILSLPRTKLWC